MSKKLPYVPPADLANWEKWSPQVVANLILSFFYGNHGAFFNWGFFLFDKEFDGEPELRNKIGIVWLQSLIDSLDMESRVLEKMKMKSRRLDSETYLMYCNHIHDYCRSIEDLLRMYSREEQILIKEMREQLVHSWLAATHRAEIAVKYVGSSGYVVERLAHNDYHDIIREFYANERPVDELLKPLIDRLVVSCRNMDRQYWHNCGQLNIEGMMAAMSNEVYGELRRLSQPED